MYFQIPPTPTPLPDIESAPVEMTLSAWDYTESGIQFWNSFSEIGVVVQAVVLLFIITGIVMIVWHQARNISVIRND